MARPIHVRPGGDSVEVFGAILGPGPAPLKIDIWRHVRHPPPELLHVANIKAVHHRGSWFVAGDGDSLIGKVLTWVWDCSELAPTPEGWRLRVDVRQGGVSVPGYPAEYAGKLPRSQPLTVLRIAEPVRVLSQA